MRVIRNGSAMLSAVFLAVCLFCLIQFSYLSADARYARDNLEYLTTRMSALGIHEEIQTHGLMALGWPLPAASYKVAELSDAWTKGYLGGIGEGGISARDGEMNPYDTLSRLVLTANDDRVQVMYEDAAADAAVCNPEMEMDRELLEIWLKEKERAAKAAYQAYEELSFSWAALCAVTGFAWIFYFFFLFLCRKKPNKKFPPY